MPGTAATASPGPRAAQVGTAARGEQQLMVRVIGRWGTLLQEACRYGSVRPAFLAALVANESGGDPAAVRFEPAVYRHLVAVALGQSPRYGGLTRARLEAEVAEVLHPKAAAYHDAFLASGFVAAHRESLAKSPDEGLRELATSWGLTQIMGYHMVGRRGTPRDLLEPRFHLRVALGLLAEFAERFGLDLRLEFAELFRCWNTGRPDGVTADPAYVEKGLRRMDLFTDLMANANCEY